MRSWGSLPGDGGGEFVSALGCEPWLESDLLAFRNTRELGDIVKRVGVCDEACKLQREREVDDRWC